MSGELCHVAGQCRTGVHLDSVRNVAKLTTSPPDVNTLSMFNVDDVENSATKTNTTPMTRTEANMIWPLEFRIPIIYVQEITLVNKVGFTCNY